MSIKDDLGLLKSKLEEIEVEMNKKIEELAKNENELGEKEYIIKDRLNLLPKVTKLNIGGQKFSIYTKYLVSDKNSLFYFLLLNMNMDHLSSEIYFERNPKYFEEIINFLKHGFFNSSKYNQVCLNEILQEAKYYELNELINQIKGETEVKITKIIYDGAQFFPSELYSWPSNSEELNNEDNFVGVAAKPNEKIMFELNKVSLISKVDLRSILEDWTYFTNSVTSTLEYSLDKNNWTTINVFLSGLNSNEIKYFEFSPVKAKYFSLG